MSLMWHPGDHFADRFEIQSRLGEGHRKVVYLARDTQMHREVALALLKPESVEEDPEAAEHETKVLGAIGHHENIVRLYERNPYFEPQYMVFEYLSGGTLAEHLTSRSSRHFSADHVLRLARQLSRALSHLHLHGVIHRDLCPSNVWLDERLGAHLGDFDTAILLDDPPASRRQLTNEEFASPEELDGLALDGRADLFSLGGVLLCIAACTESFHDPHALKHVRSDLPRSFADLIARLQAQSPVERPTDAEDVLKWLDQSRADLATNLGAPDAEGELPQPSPQELKSSSGVRDNEYTVDDVIDGRFRVLGILGEGAFSKVYRVRDEMENEERAFKLFRHASGYEAVRREIGALRKIHHPKVVEVFWADKTDAGDWYLVSEFIEGESLEEYVEGKSHLRDREAVDVVLDVLEALVAIHPASALIEQLEQKAHEDSLSEAEFEQLLSLRESGLVHRDVKPSNIILTRTGAKLLDFNIASRVGERVKTRSGTPAYQAPDAELTLWDVSTDLFAAGVILYQLLCDGQHPYPGSQPRADQEAINPRTWRSDLSRDLGGFLVKSCAPERSERFTTATEMRDVLTVIRTTI